MSLEYSHSAFGFIYRVRDNGEMYILCFQTENQRFPSRWVLPGGSSSGVVTPLETVQRECRQELAKKWRDIEGFHVEFEKEPAIIIRKNPDGGRGGLHEQHFFIGCEVIGELRDTKIHEPDGGQDILGVPIYMELTQLVRKLQLQEKKSHNQLKGVIASLDRLCSKDTPMSLKVFGRYSHLLIT